MPTSHGAIASAADIHEMFQYVQSSDPGAVGAGKNWLDTTTASAPVYKRRNAGDTGWITMFDAAGGAPALYNREEMQVIKAAGSTSVTVLGADLTGSVTATQTSADDADGKFINQATSNVLNNFSGYATSIYNKFRRDHEPDFVVRVKTDPTTIASVRYWIGLFSGDPQASATPALSYVAFRYDTGADGTAFWRTATDNGSGSPTVTATTQSIAVDTAYDLRIVCRNASNDAKFYINDVLVATHTATLPTATTAIGYAIRVTTLAAAVRNLKWGGIYLSQKR